MLGTISQIDSDQLQLLLQRSWIRRINAVHIHHTWRPNHSQWRGQSTVEAMRRFHVEQNGWSDIAQHVTIGADGSLWTGRHLDRPPASIAGHNGSAKEGPFMIEMVGDFDEGQDCLEGKQAASVYQTVADICARFKLDKSAIRFHNEFAAKTCPGTSLKLETFRDAVAAKMTKARRARPSEAARAYAQQTGTNIPGGRALDSSDAELLYDAVQAGRDWSDGAGERGFGAAKYSADNIDVFKSHVINLSGGQLSRHGGYQNSEADLDELITRLGNWVNSRNGEKARLVFFAHGGLVDEAAGLDICLRDKTWWLANDVYPIFFVWETGFMEALEQEWRRHEEEAGRRGFISDITDPLLEWTLGPVIGQPSWGRIKTSALLSSSEMTGDGKPGGAAVFLTKLANWFGELTPKAKATVELHAVGHSAGSIFHCHFLPALEKAFAPLEKAPKPLVSTLAFLAPAVRLDLFKQRLMPLIGKGVGAMSMFTMDRRNELEDDVIKLYRKSLLYFVRNACEDPTHSTPILGLEESVRADPELVDLFGLDMGVAKADVIWSPTEASNGKSATKAVQHGEFDNDTPTMNSVLRRILDMPDQPLPCPHLPASDKRAGRGPVATTDRGFVRRTGVREEVSGASGTGMGRNALCIGIDDYGAQSLSGCVADAGAYANALRQWGFTVQQLTNGRATRKAIAEGIDQQLSRSRPGDVVVIQFAGHGTQLPDLSGDEADHFDEAWVPYDFNDGEFVIDDDIGVLLDKYRDRGIELVLFTDCCHSGTSTRFMPGPNAPQSKSNSRYLKVPRDIERRYLEKRGREQTGVNPGAVDSLGWEIHFAACQDQQSAYEHDGHGDFTRAVTKALANALRSQMSYSNLAAAIAGEFSGNNLQTPGLRALPVTLGRTLFAASRNLSSGGQSLLTSPVPADIAAQLEQLAASVEALSKKIDNL